MHYAARSNEQSAEISTPRNGHTSSTNPNPCSSRYDAKHKSHLPSPVSPLLDAVDVSDEKNGQASQAQAQATTNPRSSQRRRRRGTATPNNAAESKYGMSELEQDILNDYAGNEDFLLPSRRFSMPLTSNKHGKDPMAQATGYGGRPRRKQSPWEAAYEEAFSKLYGEPLLLIEGMGIPRAC